MAAMGGRKMTKKNHPDPRETLVGGIAIPAVNLGTVPTMIWPVTTQGVQPSVLGSPIMREDFITTTGIMLSKFD